MRHSVAKLTNAFHHNCVAQRRPDAPAQAPVKPLQAPAKQLEDKSNDNDVTVKVAPVKPKRSITAQSDDVKINKTLLTYPNRILFKTHHSPMDASSKVQVHPRLLLVHAYLLMTALKQQLTHHNVSRNRKKQSTLRLAKRRFQSRLLTSRSRQPIRRRRTRTRRHCFTACVHQSLPVPRKQPVQPSLTLVPSTC